MACGSGRKGINISGSYSSLANESSEKTKQDTRNFQAATPLQGIMIEEADRSSQLFDKVTAKSGESLIVFPKKSMANLLQEGSSTSVLKEPLGLEEV